MKTIFSSLMIFTILFSSTAYAKKKMHPEKYKSETIKFYKELRTIKQKGVFWDEFPSNNKLVIKWRTKFDKFYKGTEPNYVKGSPDFEFPYGDSIHSGDLYDLMNALVFKKGYGEWLAKWELAMICYENPKVCNKYIEK